eukprot:gene15669-4716_t
MVKIVVVFPGVGGHVSVFPGVGARVSVLPGVGNPRFRGIRPETALYSAADRALPLHMKQVEKMNYDTLLAIRPELRELIAWNTDPSKYGGVLRGKNKEEPVSDISSGDLKKMIEADYVEEIPAGSAQRLGCVFTVVEEEKQRRRLIFWPKQLNNELREYDPEELGLEPIELCFGKPERD